MHAINPSAKKVIALTTIGSTSVLALLAGTTSAQAIDFYAGASAGMAFGDVPAPGSTSYPEDYALSGAVLGGFFGAKSDIGNGMMAGVELALTGPTEGDADGNAGYDYSYDVNWMLDSKLRLGGSIGNIEVYGFAGLTVGNANNYWTQYSVSGVNYGIGAEMPINANMSIGIEGIQREMTGYGSSSNVGPFINQAVSVRASFDF